ncbi:MAG: VWA domain-containing protein [Pseudomonadales bacterium]
MGERFSLLKVSVRRVPLAAVWLWLATGLAAAPATGSSSTAEAPLDVRLLVDVSGSMAKSDPDGLLSPAVQLFLELLPEGAKAGVWTFAQQVNQLVKYDRVTPLWRAQAQIQTSKLPTTGLRTALGDAVATASWDHAGGNGARHLVLLSDGRLDLADEAQVNQAGRQQLLAEQLPRLAAAGFKVHTVALSKLGDLAFLRQVAQVGNGTHQIVRDLGALPETLIGLFAQIGPADRLPVVPLAPGLAATASAGKPQSIPTAAADATFLVEPDLAELTLVARTAEASELGLLAPAGERYDRYAVPAGSRWHVTPQYEILTMNQPAAGTWRIAGASSAQVFTYGDLRLRLLDSPAQVAPGALQAFAFALEDRRAGTPVDPAFLGLVEFAVQIESESGHPSAIVEPDGAGQLHAVVADLQGVERAVLTLTATGPTFARTLRYPFEVLHPLRVEMRPGLENEAATLWVTLNQPGLDYTSVQMAAGVRQPPGSRRWHPLARAPGGLWSLQLPGSLSGKVEIEIDVRAKYLNNGEFGYRSTALSSALPLAAAQRFSFDDEGRADQPARLVNQAAAAFEAPPAAIVQAEAEPATAQADSEPAAQNSAAEVTAGSDAMVQALTVPVWFAAAAMLIPLGLIFGLAWFLKGLQIHPAPA